MSIAYLYMNRRRLTIEQQKDKIEQKSLRSQMNPNFIFNAISSIHNYLYDKNDLKIALTYMSQFGELMRQILENSREEFMPISEEIETLRNYLELQQLRYSNSFGYEFIIDEDIDTHGLMVLPLIAQPFVENSIEHGMIYRIENGIVKIKFSNIKDKLEISIEDNGIGSRSIEVEAKNIEQKKKSLRTIIIRERD
ncbi:MAG: sensor histidine kinase YesM [Saprospiraceae bacterium]|jgi:sensor histidine kinase YesM